MSSKFSCELAEELWEQVLDSFQDEEFGDSDKFGWFALFREAGAILSVNSQGFVDVSLPDNLDAAWNTLRDESDWYELSDLNESCDDLFVILDTARHGGWVPDFEDVARHIESCKTCESLGNYLEI